MTADRPFYIYCHIAPNGKRYIGQTRLRPERRWNNGNGYRIQPYFRRAIGKYGWDNFEHVILCSTSSKEYADFLEQWFIEKYDTTNPKHGYNCAAGGAGPNGVTWGDERKKAFSERMSGENNPMYGKHHSECSKRRMSEMRSGGTLSPEMREFRTNILLEANKKRQIPIRQLDLDGNLVATYSGIGEAARATGYSNGSIWNVCRGRTNQAYGFRWEYEDETLRAEARNCAEERARKKAKKIKRCGTGGGMAVIQFDIAGNEVARYSSLSDAERKTGLHRDRIGDCCHGGLETYGGFIWKFENEGQSSAESTAVIQRDLDGNEIARFSSLAKASALTGIPRYQIRHVCCGRQKTTHGFTWEFVDKSQLTNTPKQRGVIQLDMDGNEVARYTSVSEAMRQTGQDKHMIADCCKGTRHSYRNTRWQYANAT